MVSEDRAMSAPDLIDRAAPRKAMERERDALTNGFTQIAMADGLSVALFLLDKAAPRAATEPLTRERLAAALHERYAAALCLDPEGPHTWPCAAFSQWMDDAASILEALATTSAPEPES